MKFLKGLLITLLILAVVYYGVTLIVPDAIDKDKNKVLIAPPYTVSTEAQSLYNSLDFIADLHCDALLWDRDLTKRSEIGHVDFPRMQEANVALQAFTIVTKSPAGQNFQRNEANAFDNITMLNVVQGRPLSNWFSLFKRAIYQCNKLQKSGDRFEDGFIVVKSTADVQELISKRKQDKKTIGGLLGIEGAHCLEGKLENVDKLYEAGVRMMAPTHFFDNALGGSAHGISGEGLTEFGEQVIDRMGDLRMIIDISHLSVKMIDDIMARTDRPVVVSHTGVKGTHDSPRNLSDAQVLSIAENGGLIGIAYFKGALPELSVEAIVEAMKYVKDLAGVQSVALGSDYDGNINALFDITGLPLVVEEMLKQGFTEAEIRAIMGGNVKRFLLQNL
jgi:microsomal dipeptidase-like Zn-dependent dipeptidase